MSLFPFFRVTPVPPSHAVVKKKEGAKGRERSREDGKKMGGKKPVVCLLTTCAVNPHKTGVKNNIKKKIPSFDDEVRVALKPCFFEQAG